MERFSQVFILVVIIMRMSSCYSLGAEIESDESSLVALKAAITTDPHNILAKNWSGDVCRWVGVTCDSSHTRVTELDLSNMGLVGSIAPEIGNISSLVSLHMNGNFLHGPIPPSIFNMSSLEDLVLLNNSLSGRLPRDICVSSRKLINLVLSFNNLYGEIPLSLHHCSQLEGIYLPSNNFTGHLPREIGNITSLKFLSLYENNISGSIPEQIGKLNNLEMLDMGYNKLSGKLPPTDLSNMSSLAHIDLSGNTLSGALPAAIGNLNALLNLLLGGNAFSGNIPGELFNTSIQVLSLEDNLFQGSIPLDIGKSQKLAFLRLSGNQLSGSIPSTIGNLSYLNVLSLSSNKLIGEIPSTFGNLSNMNYLELFSNKLIGEVPFSIANSTSLLYLLLSNNSLEGAIPHLTIKNNLKVLHLNGNRFSGPIPSTIFREGCRLISINLNTNQLEGGLPKSLLNCKSLIGFDIGNNGIQDKFPFWMDVLPYLRVLVLRSNNFHGTLPPPRTTELPFSELQVFDISRNSFTGPPPERYFKNFRAMINVNSTEDGTMDLFSSFYTDLIITFKGADHSLERLLDALTTVDLSCNAFSGTIPASIGDLNSLKYLNLSHNNLIGNIPASLGNMTALESLDLSTNKLDGEIPRELARLTFISVLDVSMNNLVKSTQFSTFGNDSFMGNPGLCGVPLTRKCKDDENGQVDDDDMNYEGFIDGFSWRAVVMGYGCGLAVGIAVGSCILMWKANMLTRILFWCNNEEDEEEKTKNLKMRIKSNK